MDIVVPLDKGLNTTRDPLRLPAGFLLECSGAIYIPDDPDRPHKIPDRSSAGSLPGAATAANTYGLAYLEFDNSSNVFLLFSNGKLYSTAAATTIGAWTTLKDAASTDYALTGSWMKAIPDGKNRWIAFTGASSERPIVVDEDGNARYLSMKKASAPTVAEVTVGANEFRPLAAVDTDGSNTAWNNPGNARDGDTTTAASKEISAAGTIGSIWKFDPADAHTTSGDSLYVKLGVSSLPPEGDDPIRGDTGSGGTGESVTARLEIAITEDADAGTPTYTTVYSQSVPTGTVTVQTALTDALDLDAKVKVRIRLIYTDGTAQVIGNIYEIWVSDGANTATVTDGTYYYAVTEVYKRTLASGVIDYVEGAPSDTVAITLSSDYGAKVTFANTGNNGTDTGIPAANLFFRIYRSTSTGAWPDLGLVGEVASTETSFTDTFEISGTTLGTPSLNTVDVSGTFINAAGQVGSIYDAVLYNGALIYIDTDARKSLRWTLPGTPDYAPLPAHDLALLPSERNDDLMGVTRAGDNIIVFLRTRVLRVRDLPMADRPLFDLGSLQIDVLSPNEGLAGTPRAYAHFQSESGHSVLVWISDNGIWMTDGSLRAERGLGVVKLTEHINWRKTVDTTQLTSCILDYDPVLQLLYFEYLDLNGKARTLTASTAPEHWIPVSDSVKVPKFTGPHRLGTIKDRVVGDLSGTLKHWSLNTTDLVVYNERTDGSNSWLTYLETGYIYGAGPKEALHYYDGGIYHSDWGASEVLDAEFEFRRDETGISQRLTKSGLPLRGDRVTSFGLLSRAAQAFKLRLRHNGKTTSNGSTPLRALGPVFLEAEPLGAIEKD